MVTMDAQSQQALPAGTEKKFPKQQLSKGMEHIRSVVTISDTTVPKEGNDSAPSKGEDIGADTYGIPATYLPVRKPATDSAQNPYKRTDPFQFGSRYLEEGDDIFSHNAWDHVETDETYRNFIEEQAALQRASPVPESDRIRFTNNPEKWWDKFYSNNKANFFKDRKWLFQEFPALAEITKPEFGAATVLEIGAGAGNTAFPILAANENPLLRVHACDYSKRAVQVMRESPLYDTKFMQADVWDAAGTGENALPPGIQPGSVDVAIMIFIFSALSPSQWDQALRNLWTILKPGATVLFRDYGRGDLAQVRFKKGRYLEENFYIRGDGTRVYFFEEDELRRIWTGQDVASAKTDEFEDGDKANSEPNVDAVAARLADVTVANSSRPIFEVVNLGVDRRMLVNRQRKLKMYRCWMQGLFRKPMSEAAASG